MWNGSLSPTVSKRRCEHGSVSVTVGEPEFGMAPVYVEFDHTCPGGKRPPSNDKTYTFEVELDSFMEAEDSEAKDLQSELDNMSDSEKLKWINGQLA